MKRLLILIFVILGITGFSQDTIKVVGFGSNTIQKPIAGYGADTALLYQVKNGNTLGIAGFMSISGTDTSYFITNSDGNAQLNSTGNLIINPSGDTVTVNGLINSVNLDGWFNYSDSSSQVGITPITYTTGSPLAITNDGKGTQTTDTFKPYNITQLWDTITNQFDFSELTIGDELILRVNLDITTTAVNQNFYMYLNLAIGGSFPYSLYDGTWEFKTISTRQVGVTFTIYIGNTDTRDYPTELMFSSGDNATITVNSFYITTKRRM